MISQENSTGRPLADASWLENHHRAKLPERTAFAKRLAELNPKSIVDLGCATGLWLELLDSILPKDCEFFGIDSDKESLALAAQRSKSWNRKVTLLHLDLEKDVAKIPPSDITLAFNIFPYIDNLDSFIKALWARSPHGVLAVRQYDGASIRFGPMDTSIRQKMELDLRIATENSQKFHHYDMDRTFTALRKSRLPRKFCVSIFRQNQEYHIIDVHDWGLFPLAIAFPGGWDGMRAGRRECRPNLPGILMQGDQPAFRSANMISN